MEGQPAGGLVVEGNLVEESVGLQLVVEGVAESPTRVPWMLLRPK